jgi:predicted AlkP superfamily pyrophosphatase or phosphodiesterase
MTKLILSVVVLSALAAGRAAGGAEAEDAAAERPDKKLLVIGIDGCRFDALRAAEAPHLDRLMDEGAVAEPIRIFPAHYRDANTVSGPGWSSILCGVWADKHGVVDNEFTEPNYDEFPNFLVRLKEVRPDAASAVIADWRPITANIIPAADVHRDFARDDDGDYARADVEVKDAAVELLDRDEATAAFVYFGQVDEAGHAKGFHPSVPEYIAAIERVDGYVGELLAALAGRRNVGREDWLVIVSTDHGGSGTSHSNGHDNADVARSWIIVSGAAAARGPIGEECGLVDVVPTGLVHLGVAIDPAWKLDGRPVGLRSPADAGK